MLKTILLISGDNNSTRFITYLIKSIQVIQPEVGVTSLEILQSQPKQPAIEAILGNLINEIISVDQDFILVLDDYHLIKNKEIHDIIHFLLNHSPAQMHLVIATRSDPPLMLASLRGQDQIVDIRSGDLSFTLDESADFLKNKMRLDLAFNDLQKLNNRIEGWAAGLQMAALSMKGKNDLHGFVSAFTGSNRYIMDYLIEEVFLNQSENIQRFLIQTSILHHLNDALCNMVTGIDNCREILVGLERSNLFIIPLDDQRNWYRYHHLFADLLHKRLLQEYPESVSELHQMASKWYESQGFTSESIDHLLKAKDYEVAEQRISKIAEQLWWRGEHGLILNWLESFPKDYQVTNPRLCVILALIVFWDGRFDEAEKYLVTAEDNSNTSNDKQVDGMIASVRAYVADYQGKIQETLNYGELALSSLTDEYAIWRGMASIAMGDVHVQKGPLKPATDSYKEAIRSGNIAGNNYCISLAQHRLVVMYQRRGQLRKAFQLIKQYISDENLLNNQSGALYLIYGELLYELNRLDDAVDQINKSLQLCQYQHHAAAIPYCQMQFVRIRLAQGDTQGAQRETQESMRLINQSDIPPWVESFVIAWKIRFHIMRGELDVAKEVLQQRNLSLHGAFTYPNTLEYIALARSLMAGGKYEDASQLLQRLHNRLISIDWLNLALEAKLLWALTIDAQGYNDKAMDILKMALDLVEPENYMRIFIDEGQPMKTLLQQAVSHGIQSEYVNKLLFEMGIGMVQKGRKINEPTLIEPLSNREFQDLRLLATQLTNPEIASEIFVSINTVKTHIKKIYSKLNVHTRKDAIEKAKDLGLF